MNISIPIMAALFVLIITSTNIQAFSQNTTATSGQTFNQIQANGLQSISEQTSNTTYGEASPELKELFQNQEIDANTIPSINATTTGEERAGILELDQGETRIPVIYEQMGDTSLNATEGNGIVDGDIILTMDKIGAENRIAFDRFITTSQWTNGIIPVAIHPDTPNRDNIIQAMSYVMEKTPIIFIPVEVQDGRIIDENYVVFYPSDNNCASGLGMQGGAQFIIVPSWCKTGSLVHEIGHTLGIWHEQTRCDRDQYIRIVWDNIKEEWKDQFTSICDPNRPSESPLSFAQYDLCSIMHYPTEGVTAAIDPNQPIMVPLQEPQDCSVEDIGQRGGYSPLDESGIRAFYPFS